MRAGVIFGLTDCFSPMPQRLILLLFFTINSQFVHSQSVNPVFEALGDALPIAMGIAASPWPIIALMILLMTPKSVSNSYAFLLGWFIGLIGVGVIVLQIPGLSGDSGEPSQLMGWIRLSLGAIFLIFSLLLLKDMVYNKNRPDIPKWIEKVDSYGFIQALVIGFILSGLNFKNASMVATGAASIGGSGITYQQELIVLLLFCLISSLGVLLPHTIFVLFRKNAEVIYGKIKFWLLKNRVLILLLVLVIFGGISLYKGIAIIQSF